MEPIIYTLTKTNEIKEPIKINLYFDDQPSPKLIKYGFNNIDEEIDMMGITSIPYYKNIMNFNFDSTDKESITMKASSIFQTKNFNQIFAEFCFLYYLYMLLIVFVFQRAYHK